MIDADHIDVVKDANLQQVAGPALTNSSKQLQLSVRVLFFSPAARKICWPLSSREYHSPMGGERTNRNREGAGVRRIRLKNGHKLLTSAIGTLLVSQDDESGDAFSSVCGGKVGTDRLSKIQLNARRHAAHAASRFRDARLPVIVIRIRSTPEQSTRAYPDF